MPKSVLLIILIPVLLGCSQAMVSPEDTPMPVVQTNLSPTQDWEWGRYIIAISADRTNAEVVPLRDTSFHLNVSKFVEGPPCADCLKIGKPYGGGDGTIKMKIMLTHPFPGQLEYTGFDVRGITIFKATDYYWTTNYYISSHSGSQNDLMYPVLLNYSDPAKGGAGLLNAEGYTFYLNPLLQWHEEFFEPPTPPPPPPIFNYYKGKYAVGDSPDCTINPYILFSDVSPRRMFKVTDTIVRTFHIQPPVGDGPFEFGYVVHACWAKPTNMPVTNPEVDFPIEANCEDPYGITIEQLQPINYDVVDEPLFKATIKHRKGEWPTGVNILTPTISSAPDFNPHNNYIKGSYPKGNVVFVDDETSVVTLKISQLYMDLFYDQLVPGYHLGMFACLACGKSAYGEGYYSQLYQPIGVCPVMVYVEL